jgi:sigma-B regulation protein RsbU (phosphoserine phosphatase)
VNQFSPRRVSAVLKRTSILDRVALGIILLYAFTRIIDAFGGSVPGSVLLAFLCFVAVVYFFFRFLPWFRNQMLWRLRNRLIVAYVLIAVVPVVLLLTMAAVALSLFYLQLGAHLLRDDLEERVNTISAETRAIVRAIEQDAGKNAENGNAKASPSSNEPALSRPEVLDLISGARAEFSDLQVFANRGQHLIKAGGGRAFAGLVEFQEKLWIVSVVSCKSASGMQTLLVGAPLTPAVLDGFSKELGPIQLKLFRSIAQSDTDSRVIEFGGEKYVSGQQINSLNRSLAAPQNWMDVRINGASTFELPHVEPGKEAESATLFASFSLRPSAVNRHLFSSVGALGPYLEFVLVVAGIIFLVIEIAALATGVVLTRTITRAVGDLYEATLHVRRGDFSHRVRVHKKDQLGALGESFNEMTGSIADLIEEQRQRQRLENEISIAREVQSQLFPQSLPSLPGLQLAAICRPARVVSGDYYDFIRLGPSRVGIALADISGKGIFAALLMASLQAALRSTAALDGNGGTAGLVARLNDHVFKNTSDDRYATFFYGVYDSDARTLTYTNAGHLPPFFISDGKMQQLEEGGTVVGLIEDSTYTQGVIKVAPGSLFVAFSDGLTEPENVYGEEFGVQRLKDEVMKQSDMPLDKLAQNLIASADQWAGTADQADDITVVIARMG